jgi:hypothetical protein
MATAGVFAAVASAQPQAGDVLVVDTDVPPVSSALLFEVDPQTGARTVLHSFGGGSPSSVAVEADGGILVTDTAAGTDPNGGTAEWGVLYRLVEDPATGQLARATLTDFGAGPASGRAPRAVAVEADGRILVLNGNGGTSDRAVLVRIDPVTGARAILSDFGNAGQGGLGVEPRGLAIEAGGHILVIDAQAGFGGAGSAQGELVRVHPQTGTRTSVSNFGMGANPGSNPTSVAVEADGQILATDEGHTSTTPLGLLYRIDPSSGARTILSDLNTGANTGRKPEGVAVEADGQILVVDKHAGALTRGMLFRVDPQTGARTVVSDFGVGPNGGGDPLALAVVPRRPATLRVVDEVVNDSGGSAAAGDFTVAVTGTGPSPASFAGATAPGTVVTLAAGAYAVSATGPAGYGSVPGTDCAGTIAPGETRTCTITHDDVPGTLVIVVDVVNDNGGSLVAGDWTVRVSAGHASPASFPGAGTPGTAVTLDAGTYTITVTGPAGYYQTTFTDGCRQRIALGETLTCTIKHDDAQGFLDVVDVVVNDSGGGAVAGDFTVTVTGGQPSPASFPGAGPPGTSVRLDSGAYSVTASGPAGYDSVPDADCAGILVAYLGRRCTITHDDRPGTLIVVSRVVNDDGGSATPGAFTVTVAAGDPSPASFPGAGAPGTSVTLDAGAYAVAASGPAGYTTTPGPDCSGVIALGQTRTCTLTSDDDRPATATCNGKAATIVGGPGPSDIRGTAGNDVIVDLDGSNIVRGRGGRDTVCTGAGNDQVLAGDGADAIIDTGGTNVVVGGAANDTITTGGGRDAIASGAGNDVVDSGAGNDHVDGDGGSDTLATGAGDDVVDGGLGFDTCRPGSGVNTIRRCERVT